MNLLWAETFTGTASVTLDLLGGAAPPIGFMGSKRRWARLIVDLMGQHERPDVIVLCDAGPWGEAWEVILDADRRAALGPAAVSEAVPLPLDGWHTVRLTEPHARHAEWLTMSTAPAMAWPAQLTLWATS